MSEENVEVVQRFTDAFNRRDLARLLGYCDPEIEIDTAEFLIGTPTYRGHEGIERLFHDMEAAWEELQAQILEVRAVGSNQVVVLGEAVGKGKTTGAPFAAHSVPVLFVFTQGTVVNLKWFVTKGEALEAAGVSE